MTDLAPTISVHDVQDHAARSWDLFTRTYNLDARVPDWRTGTTADGSPTVTVEVVGRHAADALSRFAGGFHLALRYPGDQRPRFDLDVPGRVVLVWRYAGVWVELWHPDTVSAPHKPVQAISRPAVAATSALRAILRPGGRLPYTRRAKTPKETTTS